jgi:predicted nucleic acid-binding Zn ribbon protein
MAKLQQESPFPAVLQTQRARHIRRIAEIANGRGWQIEVTRTLDIHQACYVDDLPDDALTTLKERMEHLEECVQCGCDPDDAPPAR